MLCISSNLVLMPSLFLDEENEARCSVDIVRRKEDPSMLLDKNVSVIISFGILSGIQTSERTQGHAA